MVNNRVLTNHLQGDFVSELALSVPPKFRRGGLQGNEQESVASGVGLIELMCKNLNREDLGDAAVLDIGCGVKIVQAILDRGLPVGNYVGMDLDPGMIDFLQANVSDPRFAFHRLNTHNEMYNPEGEPLSEESTLPVEEESFDIICLFSVFTHLAPHDYELMLKVLRPYIKPEGRIIFSLFVHETTPGGHGFIDAFVQGLMNRIEDNDEEAVKLIEARKNNPVADFHDWDPQRPLWRAIYSREKALELVESTGWEVESLNDPENYVQHYMICKPV